MKVLKISSLTLATALISVGCATTQEKDPVEMPQRVAEGEEVASQAPKPLPEPEPEPEPVVEEPTITKLPEEPKTAAPAVDTPRSGDGIDDETPLPVSGPAYDAFVRAVNTSRTNPSAAAKAFESAAGQTTYFYAAEYNAGAAAERAGDLDGAERLYKKALEIRPDYGPALTNLMLLYQRTGRNNEAEQLVSNALNQHSDKAGPYLASAMRALRRGDFQRVEREALKAVRIDERNVAARRLMARVFFSQGRYETAKFALENALVLEPGNALLHLEMGHVHLKLDDEKKATASFENALRIRPELAEAHENFGLLIAKSGDPDRALIAFQKNVQLRPQVARGHLLLGNGLRQSKRYPEAVASYQKALELNPSLVQVHFNLALLYMDNEVAGMTEEARMRKSEAEFATYVEKQPPEGRLKERIDEYLKGVKRRIRKIERKAQRAIEAAEEEKKAAERAAAKEAARKALEEADKGAK